MQFGELKPVLTALLLPPAAPVLLAAGGWLLAWRWRRTGMALGIAALALLWLLSCNAVGRALNRHLLPAVEAATAQQLKTVQAIVVLGGGVIPSAVTPGASQPSMATAGRLHHGAVLARRAGKPLAFSGGRGWSVTDAALATEASVARRAALQHGVALRWVDDQARDTAENAGRMAALLLGQGVRSIALVSDPWHLPRATREFARVGFEVVAAPTAQPVLRERAVLEWLPSGHGLLASRQALREWLALKWSHTARFDRPEP